MGAREALKWAEGLPLWKAEIRAEIGVGVRCVNNDTHLFCLSIKVEVFPT